MSSGPLRHGISSVLSFVFLLSWQATVVAETSASTEQPNIVFLLIDDQRNDTLGCAGHPIIKTPVIDRLAAEGVRFRNAFVTTSICAASRASFLTGLYERTHGFTFGTPPLRRAHMVNSYPALMRAAGYRTGFVGKFGVKTHGKIEKEIFDVFKPHNRNPYFHRQADGSLRHETEVAGDSAIAFLESNPKDKPFCLSVSFNAVHAEDNDKLDHFPWPKAVNGMYDDVTIPPPRLSDPAIFESQPEFLKNSMNRKRYFWRWDTPEKYQKNIRAYYRMISGVDHVTGRIREALDKLGLADNTVIIYMGDNGYYMGDRGFAGKWSHYEQSLRVPLIVFDPRAPRAARGVVRDEITLNVDVPATMLALAGIERPATYQGAALSPLLRGERVATWRTEFFCEHLMDHKDIPAWEGLCGERYVYARYFGQNPAFEFLHDLKSDPDQLQNLVRSPEHEAVLTRMKQRCDSYATTYAAAGKPVDVP